MICLAMKQALVPYNLEVFMSSQVVQIADEYGETSLYKKVSARIPDFIKEYPPDDGWRIETNMTDMLSLQKGRLSLIREAIAVGKKPEEVGLPGLDDWNVMVCNCTLYNKAKEAVCNRSASMAINQNKDMERLETAAFQRLLGALGFGGEIFDDDDFSNITDTNRTVVTEEKAIVPIVETSSTTSQENNKKAESKVNAVSECSDSSSDNTAGTEDENDDIPVALVRQIKSLSDQLGNKAPTVSSLDEAKKVIKEFNLKLKALRNAEKED